LSEPWERFSTASARVCFCARFEAGLVGSEAVDTQHLLLGLLCVDPSTLRHIAQPITLDSVRDAAIRWHAPGDKVPTFVDLPLSSDSMLVFENAISFADSHGFSFVRTEHLLLALMAVTASHAATILQEADASLSRLEQLVSGLHRNELQDGDPLWSEGLRIP
jgi:ATP-dependent Clp protease ATP-binding subunit ClpA